MVMIRFRRKHPCGAFSAEKMKKNIANAITAGRIALSIGLLFTEPLSALFYAIYIMAGITDMIDGTIARRLGAATEKGARIDTAADMVFVAAVLIKLIPVLEIPVWIMAWALAILIVKLVNMALNRGMAAVHSLMNKLAGLVLFIIPLTLDMIDVRYSLAIGCILASAASIDEMRRIRNGRAEDI